MWKLGNRVVIVLVCVLSGCVILNNIWKSVLGIIISLLLVIYASVLLHISETFQTPHALVLLEYFERAGQKFYNLLRNINCQTTAHTINLIETIKTFYQNYIIDVMNRNRRNTYQLSSDTFINSSKNSDYNVVREAIPMDKNRRRSYINGSENNTGIDSINSRVYVGGQSLNKITSTPLIQWRQSKSNNGDIYHRNEDIPTDHDEITLRRANSLNFHDDTVSKEDETVYSPRGSPWGTSISPKMRPRAAGVKTVQTVTGPLLTSTRYNIDPKIYVDVTSPGLSSRLANYATEANMKLTHQSQYGVGQFPKVNLNASPMPIINAKSPRGRTSVTVRVAPPDTAQYSPPDRKKILSTMCERKNKTPPSVVQVLKEISLKRHASRDDVTIELAKKQRTDGSSNDELENHEEITQKRGRDDSSKSQEEISIDNSPLRPNKRTKILSCYDILNSLSSSTNVSSGIKRKADLSRSGTPDIGKHFKSLDVTRRRTSFSISPRTYESPNNVHKSSNDLGNNESDDAVSSKKLLDSVSPNLIGSYTNNVKQVVTENEKKSDTDNSSIKLTDRLFMRAEPQNINKIKSLIGDHEKVASKFTGDDGEEIKKSDVVIMRQTSMKARLQSMFDAISGKISGGINPNVVIQAEQVNNSTSTVTPSSLSNSQLSLALTTLNSSTSTTSINTSPISTSAVVPIIGKTKTTTTPGKHVTFMLPTTTSTLSNDKESASTVKSSASLCSTIPVKNIDKVNKIDTQESQKPFVPLSSFFDTSNHKNSTLMPAFGSSTSNAGVSIVSNTNISSASSIVPTTSTNIQLFPSSSTKSPLAAAQSTNKEQNQSNLSSGFTLSSLKSDTSTVTTASFSFGTPTIVSTVASDLQSNATAITQSTPLLGFQSITTSAPTLSTMSKSSTNLFAANKETIPTSFRNITATSSSAVSTPTFTFGQSSDKPSLQQTITSTPSQGTFTFGTTANSTVNQKPVTTAQSQESAKSQTVTNTTPSTFTFSENNSNTNAPTFGTTISNASKSVPLFPSNNSMTECPPVTTSSSTFSFGMTPAMTKPAFTFGASNNSVTTFGKTQSSTLTFGSAINNSSTITTNVQSLPVFGTASTTVSQSNTTSSSATVPFTFGASNTKQTTFPSATTTTANANTNIPQFGVTPKTTETPNFDMHTTMVNTTANMSSNLSTPITTTSASLFNSANNSNNIFGQSKIMPATGVFGTSTPSSSNFTANASNNFGNTGQSLSFGTQQPITTAAFSASPSVNSMSTSATFGSSSTATPTAPTLPAFGTSNTTLTSSGFGGLKSISSNFPTSPTGFATPSPSGNLFGTQNQNPAPTFNSTAFAIGTTKTPTTAPPAFGATTTSVSTFGTSSGFGNATAPPPAFGSTITNTAFSGNFGSTNTANPVSPFGNQSLNTPTFGISNTPAVPSFGTPSTNNLSAGSGGGSGPFSFGNTSTNQSQQQNLPFTFCGAKANNDSNASAAAPFQFGAVTTPQPGGFNFTAGAPAPPFGGSSAGGSISGGGSGGGMFSIGSGTTAPRSRSTRPRRQQR